MAITSYADLVAEIDDAMEGLPIPATRMSSFVMRAEAEINRTLRVPQMIRSQIATVDRAYVRLPSEFIELKNATLIESNGRQTALTPITMFEADLARSTATGAPRWINFIGDKLEVIPNPEGNVGTLRLDFYARVPGIEVNGSNWLLLAHPDLYVALLMKHASDYAEMPQKAVMYNAAAVAIIDQLNLAGKRAGLGASPNRVRTRSYY